MRSQIPPVCAHCQSTKSPLWRRGVNLEVLCNACGLYWKHHNAYRPLSLKVAADRKVTSNSSSMTNLDAYPTNISGSINTYTNTSATINSNISFNTNFDDYKKSQNMHRIRENQAASIDLSSYHQNYVHNNSNRQENYDNQVNLQTTGPMRTSNILMMPNQFSQQNYPGISLISTEQNKVNENILPSFNHKKIQYNEVSTPNLFANQRQLMAAPILPNLDSLIKNLSSENVLTAQNSNVNLRMNDNSIQNHTNPHHSNTNVGYNPNHINRNNDHNRKRNVHNNDRNINTNVYNNDHISIKNTSHYQYQSTLNSSSRNIDSRSFSAPIKFIINRGSTIYQGDHVSIRGSDSQVYFAILLDFWLTETGRRYCTLRWLLPKVKISLISALQDRFNLGPIHERVEAMEIILDVFYSPYRDQMSAEMIRRRFLFSEPENLNVNASENECKKEGTNENDFSYECVPIDPPVKLIKAMNSIYSQAQAEKEKEKMRLEETKSFEKVQSSEIFNLQISSPDSFPEIEINNNNVPLTPITESSELAAKMLLNMY